MIGWRGMVGSVLCERILSDETLSSIEIHLFSSSQAGESAPAWSHSPILLDAYDIDVLSTMACIVSCQGGDYTQEVYAQLRSGGWDGYWLDASSALRLEEDTMIILDPVNGHLISDAVNNGIKTFVGGNCTVSLMLMAIGGLFHHDAVEWVSAMTYQAASGAGAQHMRELLAQMGDLHRSVQTDLGNRTASILEIDKKVTDQISHANHPTACFGAPLAGSLIPWIDTLVNHGQTREEWKGSVELHKILNMQGCAKVPIDGLCVRVGTMRAHAQALTIQMKSAYDLDEIRHMICSANPWVDWVPNQPELTRQRLSPAAVSGQLKVAVGRVRRLAITDRAISVFTVGDQLLWGAAEPLKRMLSYLYSGSFNT